MLLELDKAVQKEIKKTIMESLCFDIDSTSTASSILNKPLTLEDIERTVNEMEKYKIEVKASAWTDVNSLVVIDHEEIRKDIPWHTERGKTIIYNPKNKDIEKELEKNGFL